jgi:hypothetical protein
MNAGICGWHSQIIMAKHTTALDSASWQEHGHYNRAPLSKQLKELLGDYAL